MSGTSSHTIDSETNTLEEFAIIRDIYGILALMMRYPESSFCNTQLFDALETLLASLEWEEELQTIRSWLDDSADPLDDLQVAYTGLFINSAPLSTIPPYASVYMDGDKCIQGKTTETILDYYRSCGYTIEGSTEPPDHIQHQLEFLAALAGDRKEEEEQAFLRTHFRPWFEKFFTVCIQEARHPFYRTAILLIDFFTKEEQ